MYTEYSYAANETAGEKVKSANGISKGLKRLLIITGIIFAAELIWLFGITPFVPFSTIEVYDFSGFERNEILAITGINDTASFFSTNVNEVKEKLQSHILVESALVTKRFPDKISIFLNPRQPVAIALTSIDSKQFPVYIDRNGVFYKAETQNPNWGQNNYPVISGLENPQVNMRLPAALVPLTESLSHIASSSPELISAISEIRIEPKPWEGYDLVLYPVHSSIKVRVENSLTEEVLRYMLLVLNVFESSNEEAKPAEIDFRSAVTRGLGSYIIKEQSL